MLPACYADKTITASMTVLRRPGLSLCGRDLIQALNSLGTILLSLSNPIDASNGLNLQAILAEYAKYLKPTLGQLGSARTYVCQRRVYADFKDRGLSCARSEKVADELERLVKNGVLSPVLHSEWATPIMPLTKKDGSVRSFSDYKPTMNAAYVTEQYIRPMIDNLFANFNEEDVYSTQDLSRALVKYPWTKRLKGKL